MSASSRTDEALRDLRAAIIPVDGVNDVGRRRVKTVSHLEAVQSRLRARRGVAKKHRRFAIFAAAAAISLSAGAFVLHSRVAPKAAGASANGSAVRVYSGIARVTHGQKTGSVSAGSSESLSATDSVEMLGDGNAVISLPSGASVKTSASTRVVLRDVGRVSEGGPCREVVELSIGKVEVGVPRLGSHGALSVRTTEATVTVHGTQFTVEATRTETKSVTRVHVTEGVVTVTSPSESVELAAGDDWSSDRDAAAETTGTSDASPLAAGTRGSDRSDVPRQGWRAIDSSRTRPASATARSARSAPTAPSVSTEGHLTRSSTLDKENSLLEEGMAAARSADDWKAVRLFDRLIAGYPMSPVIEAARLERRHANERLEAASGASSEEHR